MFENADDPLANMNDAALEQLKTEMLNKFKASVGLKLTVVTADEQPVEQTMPRLKPYWFAAASVAAMFLLVWAWLFWHKPATAVPYNTASFANNRMQITNQTHSIYKQVLADGSKVWMSPGCRLEFPQKFAGHLREVSMTGEAFFEVKKDHAHPFVIYSGGVVTRVWGTSFRIRALSNKPTEVSVLTGKVSVKIPTHETSEVMLYPHQRVTYNQEQVSLQKAAEVQQSAMQMWQKVSMTFDNVPLNAVLSTLSKQFNVKLKTNDADFGKFLLKADFTDQNLPAILEMIENSLSAQYDIAGDEIIVTRR